VIDFIRNWWPVILAFGAFIVTIVVNVKYRIPEIIKRLGTLEEKVTADETQALSFVSGEECKEEQRRCQNRVCVKIDDIRDINTKVEGDIGKIKDQMAETNVRLAVMAEQIKNAVDKADKHTAESVSVAEEIVKMLKKGE